MKKYHKWVSYVSPRNGSVRVLACASCGVAKGMTPDSRHCRGKTSEAHMMLKRGWVMEVRSLA